MCHWAAVSRIPQFPDTLPEWPTAKPAGEKPGQLQDREPPNCWPGGLTRCPWAQHKVPAQEIPSSVECTWLLPWHTERPLLGKVCDHVPSCRGVPGSRGAAAPPVGNHSGPPAPTFSGLCLRRHRSGVPSCWTRTRSHSSNTGHKQPLAGWPPTRISETTTSKSHLCEARAYDGTGRLGCLPQLCTLSCMRFLQVQPTL